MVKVILISIFITIWSHFKLKFLPKFREYRKCCEGYAWGMTVGVIHWAPNVTGAWWKVKSQLGLEPKASGVPCHHSNHWPDTLTDSHTPVKPVTVHIEEQKHSFLCELFNMSRGPIFLCHNDHFILWSPLLMNCMTVAWSNYYRHKNMFLFVILIDLLLYSLLAQDIHLIVLKVT